MPEINGMYAMVKPQLDGVLTAGHIYFSSFAPWEAYRLASAIHILNVGENSVRYERQRYRTWGNLFKLEGGYTTDTIEDDPANLFVLSHHRAIPINANKCIFSTDNFQYAIGKTVPHGGKIHGLELGEETMWNGTKYYLFNYYCSDVGMAGLSEMFLNKNNDVTMSLSTLEQQTDIITCSNCLRKLA